jgi:arylsulfatase A-like enzyme
VADGLRPTSVNAEDTPNLHQIQQEGVQFANSHSLFPTFTTSNASAIATGHYLGDTGDFSNTIDVGVPVKAANGSRVPFLENNAVLEEINERFNGNYLGEESLLEIARAAGFSTAAVGKVGPVSIQVLPNVLENPLL